MSHAIRPYRMTGKDSAGIFREQSGVLHEYWPMRENSRTRKGKFGHIDLDEYDTTQVKTDYTSAKFRAQAKFDTSGAKLVNKDTAASADEWWASGTTPWAFALWVRPQLATTFQVVMAKTDTAASAAASSWRLCFQEVGGIDIFFAQSSDGTTFGDGNPLSTVDCSTNTWYHVYWGYDGTNLVISVNNETLVTDAASTINAGTQKVAFGGTEPTSAGPFTGEICEVIYRRGAVFSATERSELYNGGTGSFLVWP